jgi:peptidoglycan/xylan/chitin deacetylase (PgdA/CDA1 family)
LQLPAAAFPIAELIDTDQPPWWMEVADLAPAAPAFTGTVRTDHATLIRRLKRAPDATRRRVMGELRRAAGRPAVAARQLRSAELLTLESNGIAIGNHTLSHPCLPRCDDQRVETEVEAAHERLTAILGHPPMAFCYPNGDWDARAEPILGRLGYEHAFLFDHRLCDPIADDPLRVPRIRTDATASMDRFVILASGLHPALHRLRGRA